MRTDEDGRFSRTMTRFQARPGAEGSEQTGGPYPHEEKEGVAVISDKEVVLSSRNLQERLFLAKRNIAYAGAQGKGSTKHVSTYD